MIIKNNEELAGRYYGSKVVSAIYRGTRLIWEAINSCFGSGFWVKDKGWNSSDPWIRNSK